MGEFNQLDGLHELPMPKGVVETPDDTIRLRKPISNWSKARYEDWLEGTARRRVFELHKSGELDSQQFKDSMGAVQMQVAAMTFSWGGDAWERSLQQLPGIAKMIEILAADADRKQHLDQKVDAYKIILAMSSSPEVAAMVGTAVREVLASSPNFMCPPVRGATMD